MMATAYTKHERGSLRAEVLEIVRELPGSTSREIATLMPHANAGSVQVCVHNLKNEGIIEEIGKKNVPTADGYSRSCATYGLSANPTPNVVKMKRTAPSEAALHMRLREAEATIAELRAWKENAIGRYPDLAVSPLVLKARKLVAEEVRTGGDTSLAAAILAGQKDDTLMMRVTIKALEENAD